LNQIADKGVLMKIVKTPAPISMFAGLLLLITCGNETGNPTDNTIQQPAFVGTWQGVQCIFTYIVGDSVRITADIKPDSTYRLFAQYATSGDTALRDEGRWSAPNGDTIFLAGTDCSIIDTAADTLKNIACGAPIPIAINIANNEWLISGKDLIPVAGQMGINLTDPQLATYVNVLTIVLKKKS